MTDNVAHLDFAQANSQAFAKQLFESLHSTGFVVINNHGIPRSVLDKAYAMSRELFALPEDVKKHYDSGDGGERGWTAFGREHARDSSYHDLKEHWHIGPDLSPSSKYYERYPQNIWPEELPEFRDCFLNLWAEFDRIALALLKPIGQALGVPENFFPELIRDGNSILRLLHYPPIPASERGEHMRAAPHCDINLITLLVGASSSGLQIQDRDGNWLDIDNEPDEIVVDNGDMMALISNNLLPATCHRVVNSADERNARYSMPYFLHPHSDAILAPLPDCVSEENPAQFEPIRARDYLNQRLREIGLKM